jgi:hypothetical protein
MQLGFQKYSDISHIELWQNQRDANQNLIDKIVNGQLEYYKKYGEFTFPGSLVIVRFKGEAYLIDGQHRFKALEILYNKYNCDIEITIQIYVCDSKKQIDELYCMLNQINTNNCMVMDGKIDPEGEKLKQIKTMLKEKYGYKIWDDVKTVKPYVNTKLLDSEFKNSKFFTSKTVNEIIASIEEQNTNYALVPKSFNKVEYNKMMELGGFVLQCRTPKAIWVQTLF